MTTAEAVHHTVDQHASHVFDYLVKINLDGRVVTYTQACAEIKMPGLFPLSLGRALQRLYEVALLPLRLPNLTALVVKDNGSGRPGNFETAWTLTYGDGLAKDADLAYEADVMQCQAWAERLATHEMAVAVRTKLLNW